MGSLSYGQLTGRQVMAPESAPTPQMSVTGAGAPAADASMDDARSMLNLRESPSVWFLVLFLGAAYLARAAGFLRG